LGQDRICKEIIALAKIGKKKLYMIIFLSFMNICLTSEIRSGTRIYVILRYVSTFRDCPRLGKIRNKIWVNYFSIKE
jgi:hypothetical protein